MASRLAGFGRIVPVPGPRSARWPDLGRAAAPGHRAHLALMLRRFWLHQSILPVTWGGGVLTCAGLAVFLVAGEPQGGQPTPKSPLDRGRSGLHGRRRRPGGLGAAGIPGPARRSRRLGGRGRVGARGGAHKDRDGHVHPVRHRWNVPALAGVRPRGEQHAQASCCSRRRCTHQGPLRSSQPFLVIIDPLAQYRLECVAVRRAFPA